MYPIVVAGMARHQARVAKWLNRRRPHQSEPIADVKPSVAAVFHNADGSPNKQPALQGYACLHDQPFIKDGRIVMFASGCFIKSMCDSTSKKRVLLHHDDSQIMGSTETGLEFSNSLEGLAFRFPLSGNPNAAKIKGLVDSADVACVSVGVKIVASENVKLHGIDVVSITEARLEEISLVADPAVSGTFASIVDLDREDPILWSAARSVGFKIDKVASNTATNGRRLEKKLTALKKKVEQLQFAATAMDFVDGAAPQSEFTVAQSNRWQTAEIERLQGRTLVGLGT